MRIKIKNKTVTTDKEIAKISNSVLLIHKNIYNANDIFLINGKRAKLDFLIKCKNHGWFTITKKAFKKGSGCKECSRLSKNKKISETLTKSNIRAKGGQEFIKKECIECGDDFLVKNVKKLKKRKTCSEECYKKQSSNRFIKLNQDQKNNLKKSIKMKKEYARGERNPTSGFAKWIKYKSFKVQGEFEYEVCKALDILLKNKDIYDWEYTNDRYPYLKLGKEVSTYLIDFKVYLTKSIYFYIETKGFATLNDLYKWKKISSAHSLKVFYQREHMLKIIENPMLLLTARSISNSIIDSTITKTNSLNKEFKQAMLEYSYKEDKDLSKIPF